VYWRRRVFVVAAVAVVFAGPALAQAATRSQIKVRLIQESTYQLPHHTYQTTLRLFALGTTLGFPDGTPLGTMRFTWQLSGSCSTTEAKCTGTASIATLTKFPGGTISAQSRTLSLAHGMLIPVQGGTGAFKGASGTIAIAPGGVAESIYNILLP
jgi:hypothetical protein